MVLYIYQQDKFLIIKCTYAYKYISNACNTKFCILFTFRVNEYFWLVCFTGNYLSLYVQRLNFVLYLEANKIKDADQSRAILFSVCNPATYQLICSLVSPKKLTELLKFEEIVDIVQLHHDPKSSVIVQQIQFNTCNHHARESTAVYVAKIRSLSEHCNFWNTLNEMLCDKLVCEVEETKLQRHLLAKPNLTFGNSFKIARPTSQ